MPKVEVKTKVVMVEQAVPDGYTLHLTEDEARALLLVLGRIGGGGPLREHLRSLFVVMREAGVPWSPGQDIFDPETPALNFKDGAVLSRGSNNNG